LRLTACDEIKDVRQMTGARGEYAEKHLLRDSGILSWALRNHP
jgi:hypothetical protein